MPKTLFKTEIPYGLVWDKGTIEVLSNGDLFLVSFKRLYRQTDDIRKSPVISQAQGVEVLHDRSGGIAYTAIDVLFPMLIEENRRVFRQALSVINRMIEVYRLTTKEFHLEAIPESDLQHYVILFLLEDGSSMIPFEETASFGTGLTIARTMPISDEARRILTSGERLPIPKMLLMNAHREQHVENYRLAVIEAETAVEALVVEIIANYYRGNSVSEGAIEKKLDAGWKDLLKNHIPKCLGTSFVGAAEYSDWENNLYKIRNAVVHRGAAVDPEQSKKAVEAATQALDWFYKKMPLK